MDQPASVVCSGTSAPSCCTGGGCFERVGAAAQRGEPVDVTLEPAEGGTSVRLVHAGLNAEQVTGHLEGWNHYLDRLVAGVGSESLAVRVEWLAEAGRVRAAVAVLDRRACCGVPCSV